MCERPLTIVDVITSSDDLVWEPNGVVAWLENHLKYQEVLFVSKGTKECRCRHYNYHSRCLHNLIGLVSYRNILRFIN